MASRKSTGKGGTSTRTRTPSRAKAPSKTTLKVVAPTPEAAPEPAPAATPEMSEAVPMLRKRQLLERVVERTGLSKSVARSAIEATTATIAEALRKGETVDAGGLGKLRVTRSIGEPGSERLVLRTRLPRLEAAADPLAKDGEEG